MNVAIEYRIKYEQLTIRLHGILRRDLSLAELRGELRGALQDM